MRDPVRVHRNQLKKIKKRFEIENETEDQGQPIPKFIAT